MIKKTCTECDWAFEAPEIEAEFATHVEEDHKAWHAGNRAFAEAMSNQVRQFQMAIGRENIAMQAANISLSNHVPIEKVITTYAEALRLLMGGE